MPFPALFAWLATITEVVGAICLLVGFATRWVSLPLMITMLVAAFTVHIQNGWLAIAGSAWPFASERTLAALERLDRAKSILQEHGHYAWLTEHGGFVVLNNGIQFAATYFIMLLALFYVGAGKLSVDHLLARQFGPHST